MPWGIKKKGSKYCVVVKDTGKEVGCHDTVQQAKEHQKALYANAGKEHKKTKQY
jgi:hypothetical protein